MSKRKQTSKKKVHQPDDKLFKQVMEQPVNAIEFVKTRHPTLAKKLDLSTFKVEREKLSIPNFKNFEADIVYSCQFKGSKEKLNLSLLWENKSEPDEYIFIQIGLYLFLRYYKMVKSDNLKLEPIIPLIFYNGKKEWVPKTLKDLFKKHTFLKVFKKYLPDFGFLFTNITKVPLEELLQIEAAFFKSAMIAMANKHDYDLLLQHFPLIFDVEDEDVKIAMVMYVFALHERLPEQVKKDVSPFSINIKNTVMSTFAKFKEEGKIEGIIEGTIKGKIEGKIERDIEIAITMNKNGFSITQISSALSVDEAFVIKAIESEKK